MTEGNGRITTQKFYEELIKVKEEQASTRLLLEKYHGDVKVALKQIENNEGKITDNADDIDSLEKSDKRWASITGIASGGIAAAIAWLMGKN